MCLFVDIFRSSVLLKYVPCLQSKKDTKRRVFDDYWSDHNYRRRGWLGCAGQGSPQPSKALHQRPDISSTSASTTWRKNVASRSCLIENIPSRIPSRQLLVTTVDWPALYKHGTRRTAHGTSHDASLFDTSHTASHCPLDLLHRNYHRYYVQEQACWRHEGCRHFASPASHGYD